MRVFVSLLICTAWLATMSSGSLAEEYERTDGTILRGEVSSCSEFGLVVRLQSGGFSERIPWGRLNEATLRKLANDPRAREHVEPFLEPDVPETPVSRVKQIAVKPVPRVERPDPDQGVLSAFTQPGGLLFLAVLYLTNLYAGYAVARYRNRSVAQVCVVSAILPWLGPILYLAMPAADYAASDTGTAELPSGAPEPINPMAPSGKAPQSSLSLASTGEKSTASPTQTATYNRGDTTFNRKFFETKFPNFFRVVQAESEKDLVLVVRAGRNEYVARRVTRISMNEMHLQLVAAGAPEVSVSFAEVIQVQVRHKDAKG